MSLSGKPQRKVFVGGSSERLAKAAQACDPHAWLIDRHNCNQYLSTNYDHDTTVYTSVADMPRHLDRLLDIMLTATAIVYVPETDWLTHNLQRSMYDVQNREQGMLESLLIQASRHVPILGLDQIITRPAVLDLCDQRCSQEPQIWAVGCSNTVAVAVEPKQSWARVLAHQLDQHVSVLALAGSSLSWAADQILRSDIRSGDTVIWALTNPNRHYLFQDDVVLCLTSMWFQQQGSAADRTYPRHLIVGQHAVYSSFQAIAQVKNFCAKIGARLIMFNTLPVNADLDQFFLHDPDYHVLDQNFIMDASGQRFLHFRDRGSDGRHPGPLQHEIWANELARILT